MSFFRPLRNNRTRFSSRGMMGVHRRPPGNAKPVMADLGPWGPAPQDYMQSAPQSYEPHPGFAEFSEPEYEQYDPGIPHTHTPMFRAPGLANEQKPAIPEYNDSLVTDELLAEALDEAIARPEISEPIPYDQAVGGQEMMNGDSLDNIVMDQAQNDPAQEIEAAFDQQMQQMAEPFPQEAQPEPMQGDPFQEQQQMYDEQMQQMMDPFGMPGPGPMI